MSKVERLEIGDRVKVVEDDGSVSWDRIGRNGTLFEYQPESAVFVERWGVKFDNPAFHSMWISVSCLEKIERKQLMTASSALLQACEDARTYLTVLRENNSSFGLLDGLIARIDAAIAQATEEEQRD